MVRERLDLNVGDEVGESDIETVENNYDNTSRGEQVIEESISGETIYVDMDECGNVFDIEGNLLYGDGVCEVAQQVIDSQVMDVYIHEEQIKVEEDIPYNVENPVISEQFLEVEELPEIDTRCYVHWVAMIIAIFFVGCSIYRLVKRRV